MKKLFALLAIAALVAFAAPAFAANPFADVPMNHWAYDAVGQLAASGIVTGYPDGAFKGGQAATRYEVASVVARALANVDMNKASKQDLEMLKKLVVEFKSELDALGVKVDKLDARVALSKRGSADSSSAETSASRRSGPMTTITTASTRIPTGALTASAGTSRSTSTTRRRCSSACRAAAAPRSKAPAPTCRSSSPGTSRRTSAACPSTGKASSTPWTSRATS